MKAIFAEPAQSTEYKDVEIAYGYTDTNRKSVSSFLSSSLPLFLSSLTYIDPWRR